MKCQDIDFARATTLHSSQDRVVGRETHRGPVTMTAVLTVVVVALVKVITIV